MNVLKSLHAAGLLALAALLNPAAGSAAESPADAVPEQYRFIAELFPDVEVTAVRESVLPGFVEMEVGADLFYVTSDGRYLLQGEVFDIATKVSLTESAKTGARREIMAQFDASSSILFAADEPIATVTVFTDIDCGYCRKLHREVADFNAKGISIRYLFFPRSGPGSESWLKAEEVWCAESRQEALTKAKNNEDFATSECDASVVAEHYAVVDDLGLRGTPALLTESGVLMIGYRTPDELLEVLSAEM